MEENSYSLTHQSIIASKEGMNETIRLVFATLIQNSLVVHSVNFYRKKRLTSD